MHRIPARRRSPRSPRHRTRVEDQRGQGTVEYVGLILLVSLLMVGMVVAMKGFNEPRL
jgi:hypothetical protein